MVSIQRPSQAEQVASNARLRADGGFIFADAPNAVISAAVIVHQISMHRNIAPLRVTRSSRASSRASSGFTTIVLKNRSPARSFTLRTRIRWINQCRDRPERCRQIGKRCLTNRGRLFGFRSRRHRHQFRCGEPVSIPDPVRGPTFSGSCPSNLTEQARSRPRSRTASAGWIIPAASFRSRRIKRMSLAPAPRPGDSSPRHRLPSHRAAPRRR
jgi:hypothetical protein